MGKILRSVCTEWVFEEVRNPYHRMLTAALYFMSSGSTPFGGSANYRDYIALHQLADDSRDVDLDVGDEIIWEPERSNDHIITKDGSQHNGC